LKLGDDGVLLHVDLAKGKHRFGGSALAHVFDQIGNVCPDLDDVSDLKRFFNAVQDLVAENLVSAGRDISDGGIVVSLLEMVFAGNCRMKVHLSSKSADTFGLQPLKKNCANDAGNECSNCGFISLTTYYFTAQGDKSLTVDSLNRYSNGEIGLMVGLSPEGPWTSIRSVLEHEVVWGQPLAP